VAEAKQKSSGFLAPVEQMVMPVASTIPVQQVKTWLAAYFHPMETYEANKKDSNAGSVAVHLALIGVLSWLVSLVAVVLGFNFGGLIVMVPGIIIFPIIMVVAGFIGSIILFVLAKIFGGKGGFMEQTLALALIFGGATALAAPFNALSGLPLVGGLIALVGTVIAIYNFYNEYLIIKGIHQLSSMKAALVILIPIIIAIIVAVVLAAALAVMLAGAGLAGAAAGMGGY